MGTPIAAASGQRRVQIFLIDSAGYPSDDESGANGYDGVRVLGAKGLAPSIPQAQTITHPGDDGIVAQDSLAPQEGVTATLRTAVSNLTVDAEAQDLNVVSLGDIRMIGRGSSKQGDEPWLCLISYRQAIDTDASSSTVGHRVWNFKIFPRCHLIPQASESSQGGLDENNYQIVPTPVTQYPWGHTFTIADEKFTKAQMIEGTALNPPMIEKWTGNATLTTFNTTFTPISVAETNAFVDGTVATVASIDAGAKTITLDSAPANAAKVVAFYGTSDDIG